MTIVNKVIVLDLDDTLYAEIDFLKSAYRYISKKLSNNDDVLYDLMMRKFLKGEDVFNYLVEVYSVDKEILLEWYRFHLPNITLYPGVDKFINYYSQSNTFSLVTDGRSKTQRNKINALGINSIFHNIVISEEISSEKPSRANFEKAISGINSKNCFYIGDNVKKDFITPNKMGWTTICLEDSGENIHRQDFNTSIEYLPTYRFNSWKEINDSFDTL